MGNIPIIKDDDLLTETAFYKWLTDRRNEGHIDNRFIPTILLYTHPNKKPFVGRNDGTAHKYVFNAFWHKVNKELTNS